MKHTLLVFALMISMKSVGQIQNLSDLSIDQIMQGEDFVGYLPTSVNWSDDSQTIYFSWNPDRDTLRFTYKVDINSKKIAK